MTIRNPVEWTVDQFRPSASRSRAAVSAIPERATPPIVRRINLGTLREALAAGFSDFSVNRTDVICLCLFYPIVGLILARAVTGSGWVPLLFPLASGFALLGPFFGVGLYEISRRRELGMPTKWADAFSVARSPGFGAILVLGFAFLLLFLLWLAFAWALYDITLGPGGPGAVPLLVPGGEFSTAHAPPVTQSMMTLLHDVFTTPQGWLLLIVGVGAGFLFALLAFVVGVVSFPLLVDRNVSIETAVRTSIRAVARNPAPMAAWAFVVAAALVIGTLPLFLGLVVVLPVLGHATWHLYRAVVVR